MTPASPMARYRYRHGMGSRVGPRIDPDVIQLDSLGSFLSGRIGSRCPDLWDCAASTLQDGMGGRESRVTRSLGADGGCVTRMGCGERVVGWERLVSGIAPRTSIFVLRAMNPPRGSEMTEVVTVLGLVM